MAITRTQIARQLYQRGGGADLGTASSQDFGFGNRDARDEGAIAQRAFETELQARNQNAPAVVKFNNALNTIADLNYGYNLATAGKTGIAKAVLGGILGPMAIGYGIKKIGDMRRDRDAFESTSVEEDTNFADGGMVDRQQYGLGSIVKSVKNVGKKVVKGVKDVAKSDAGKAALTAAALYYAGGGFGRLPTGFEFGNLPGASFFGTGDFNPLKTGFGYKSPFAKALESPFGKAAMVAAPSILGGMFTAQQQEEIDELKESGDPEALKSYLRRYYKNLNPSANPETVANFVRANMARGGDTAEENAMQASGIMGLPLNENPAGVTELDLRETGGFIPPVGVKEKADDIPAMLSNNEFVFTADAVRGMGDGDVNKGAQRMYTMMKKLEDGGRV